MPQIRVDPAIAANSLRIIEATQAAENAKAAPATAGTSPAPASDAVAAGGASTKTQRTLNQAAIEDCLDVPPKQRVRKLFEGACMIHEKVA